MHKVIKNKTEFLIEVIQELSIARSINQIQDIVKYAARALVGSDGSAFVLRDHDKCYYVDEDSISPLWKGQRFDMKICISGWVMSHKETVVIEDIYKDERIPIEAYRSTFVKSLVMVPIRSRDPIGAIGNYWQEKHTPTIEDIKILEALANSTSIAIENVQVYSELEQRVKDRTAQLNALNTELEAFTYSVSHDLRSPLTIIGGLSQMIQQDKKNALSEDGHYLFSRIDSNVKRMNELIDDLLMLSKISQASVNKKQVDVSILAQEIINEYCENQPSRHIDCTISPGVQVYGDPKLVRILLENLLNNALKYTSKNDYTLITLDRFTSENGHEGVFIKDNGVGFKIPDSSDELFRPFKRHHSNDEFPGSGIGLAIVKRIIKLHHGEIWPESSPNQGATFYFYLNSIHPESLAAV
ncbi:ATP-binding protein [Legionella sp. km772]|uniref:sensor histidine kinase n=1 Tax=Legionella sp. km772 TaxID=2498111 RepID=UPI000F8D61E0|nr:ATP-binding protein [Legionella sp. km772]RUR06306.1 histidine kinase [Legionella sp. km772]